MKGYPLYPHIQHETLRDLVDWCAQKYRDEPAYAWMHMKQTETRSFSQVRRDVRSLCQYLLTDGSKTGHVALLGENSYSWIISYEAVVYGGQATVPLDKDMPLEEVQEKIKDSGSDLLLLSDTYQDYVEPISKQGIRVILFSELDSLMQTADHADRLDDIIKPITGQTLASIVYTSGTTGKSKGVMLTHGNFASDIYGSCSNVFLEGSGFLLLPLHHTFGLVAAVLSAANYGKCVFINQSLRRITAELKLASPQHMFAVPLIVETLYKNVWKTAKENGKDGLLRAMIRISNCLRKVGIDLRRKLFRQVIDGLGGKLDLIVSGGAAINDKYIRGFDDFGITVLNGYGITECAPVVAVNRNRMNIVGSVGLPLPCNEVRIASDGEIMVRGSNVLQGYYHNEEATEACLKDGWFYTGDLGRLDEYGALHITGRKKNLIILSNGENISAEEIEQLILEKIDFVKEVVVSGSDDGITAECYLDPEKPEATEQLDAAITVLNKGLVSNKRIGQVRIRKTEFPKTTTKKIIRGRG